KSNWGARRVMGAQSSRSFFIQQYQYQKVLILVLGLAWRLAQLQKSGGSRAQAGTEPPQHMQFTLDLQVLYCQTLQFAAGQFTFDHPLRQPGDALAVGEQAFERFGAADGHAGLWLQSVVAIGLLDTGASAGSGFAHIQRVRLQVA